MWFQQAASWQDFETLTRRMATYEEGLRRKFWRKAKVMAADLPFAEELLTLHYCAFDRRTPLKVKMMLAGALAYVVVPDDLIPDWIPMIGYAEDAAVLTAAVKLVSAHIKPEHREAAQRLIGQWQAGQSRQ